MRDIFDLINTPVLEDAIDTRFAKIEITAEGWDVVDAVTNKWIGTYNVLSNAIVMALHIMNQHIRRNMMIGTWV